MSARPRVYFLACCFPPVGRGNALTNACVANYLADHYEVEVVCIEEAGGYLVSYQKDQSLVDHLDPRLRLHRVKAANWWGMNEFLYGAGVLPCYFLNWAWEVWRRREELFASPGVLFAVYPVFSDLVVACLLRRQYGYPLVIDLRDDFAGVMSQGWRRLLRGGYRWLERRVLRAADRITVTTDRLRQGLIDLHGLDPATVEVVLNVVPPYEGHRGYAREAGRPFTTIYAGAMSRHQRPEVLLQAYNLLMEQHPELRDQVRVEVCGPASRYFRKRVAKHLGPGIEYRGFLPHAQVVECLVEADVGFLSLGSQALAYATPTKLFEYIELEKPILAALPPGASRELIEGLRLGLVAEVGNVEQLAGHLFSLYSDPRLREELAANLRRARQAFAPERQMERWKAAVAQVVPRAGRRDHAVSAK